MKHLRTQRYLPELAAARQFFSDCMLYSLPINTQCVQIIVSKTSVCPALFLKLLAHAGGRVLAETPAA